MILVILCSFVAACSQPQPISTRATLSPVSVDTPTGMLPTRESRPTPLPGKSILPTWPQLELPPDCFFDALSPNFQWVVMRGCPSHHGDTNSLAQVDENGRLYNFREIESKLIPYLEGTGIIGFTPDSTRLIVEQDKSFGFINLADLTQDPYSPGTPGTSGVTNLGVERWSPDGRLCLVPGGLGTARIVALSASDGTEAIVVDGIGRHGAQYTWSADGQEIAYIEGNYTVSMTARILNLQPRQSRTLAEGQYPVSLTGASYSPDGKWVAIREQNMESFETAVLWLIDLKSGAKTRLRYDLSGVEVYDGWQDMVWSPDGSKLALRGSSDDNDGFVVIEIPAGKIVYRGTKETRGNPLAWSADGKSLLVLDYHSEPNSSQGTDILRWVRIE